MTQRARETWTIGDVLAWATDDFRTKGIENPRLDAEVLLAHALETTRMKLIVDTKRPLDPAELARYRALIVRRRAREPVAYLRGEREFWGRAFRVDSRVLIPRPDTETLVSVALDRTRHVSLSMRALDLCTGSGCVAISLARDRPTSSVVAQDVSDTAVAVAKDNALRLGAYNISFVLGDLYEGVQGTFDVIAANPPYIPEGEIAMLSPDIADHEPHLALSGGADGLVVIRRVIAGARKHLVAGGVLAVEVGAGQADAVSMIFEEHGFRSIARTRDYAKIERTISGEA